MVSISHELCDAQHDVCLYIDIMYSNGMPFLTTISKNIKYCTAMWVADCNAPTIASLVESVLKLYQWASFQVMEVCTSQIQASAPRPRQWMVLHDQYFQHSGTCS